MSKAPSGRVPAAHFTSRVDRALLDAFKEEVSALAEDAPFGGVSVRSCLEEALEDWVDKQMQARKKQKKGAKS